VQQVMNAHRAYTARMNAKGNRIAAVR